jgi:UDP-4-amino-4,6-dideoxy-N-acetyl-beta-L-altrosamine transaminase
MFESGFIPYGWSFLDEEDIAAVSSAMRQEIITTGPTVGEFERAFADKVGARHAVSCNSGTSALHLAAAALGLGPGDVAIVPSMTFLATANGPRYVGADVQFADVDPDSGLLTPETLERAIEAAGDGRVKAVFVVHINGQTADMEGIRRIADRHGLFVVEDACHALGTTYEASDRGSNEPVVCQVGDCRHSDMAVFSFHPVKTITTGEGGMVTTNDAARADFMVCLRTHGVIRNQQKFKRPDMALDARGERNPWYYEMHHLGFNFRITDFQCALGLQQLTKLDRLAGRRRQLMRLYDERLAPYVPLIQPIKRRAGVDPCLHLYPLLIDFSKLSLGRAELIQRLREQKIGSQVHYIPVHCQPYYRDLYGDLVLPGAMRYYERVLSIPFYPAMRDEHVDMVVDRLVTTLGL